MRVDELAHRRLRSHLLAVPAPTVADAGAHILAVQAQDFAAARWALAARTRGELRVSDVDAVFDRGELVRAWTMRGTIHALPARDLAWVLSVTGARQDRQAAGARRIRGIDEDRLRRAEAVARGALRDGGRLARAEMTDAFEQAGLEPEGQRGYHFLVALSMRGVIAQGPVVARVGGVTREQYFVLTEVWSSTSSVPADPLAEFFARFVAGHGPAGVADFAWWSGLPITQAREAAARAEQLPGRVVRVADDPVVLWVAADDGVSAFGDGSVSDDAGEGTVALAPFEEYYLPYADRTALLRGIGASEIGPGKNGMVKGIVVADGFIGATWSAASGAVGPLADRPETAAALARHAAFLAG